MKIDLEHERETKRVAQLVIDNGVFTGSRKFKTAKKDSDWDYIITPDFYDKYLQEHVGRILKYRRSVEPEDEENYDQEYFRSFNIYVGKVNINVIVPHDMVIYYQWVLAHKAVLKLPRYLLKKKKNRVKIFELFKDLSYKKAFKKAMKNEKK